MNSNFSKVARIELDVAFNEDGELEKFFEVLCATKSDLNVKVVGDSFQPKDVSQEYSHFLTPCTCSDKNWRMTCPKHGKHAYA